MQIRTALSADFPAIEALLHRAYEPVLGAMSPEHAENFRNVFSKMVSQYGEKGTWFVTESNNQLSGCVAYFPAHSVTHRLFHESWAHIQLLAVDPSHSRRGVGRKLMLHCMAAASIAGVKTFALQTSEIMAPARKLYESLGFVVSRNLEPAFGYPSYLYRAQLRVEFPVMGLLDGNIEQAL
jgi:ribosomal protein S18 acetylase RimI-like enzyme